MQRGTVVGSRGWAACALGGAVCSDLAGRSLFSGIAGPRALKSVYKCKRRLQ